MRTLRAAQFRRKGKCYKMTSDMSFADIDEYSQNDVQDEEFLKEAIIFRYRTPEKEDLKQVNIAGIEMTDSGQYIVTDLNIKWGDYHGSKIILIDEFGEESESKLMSSNKISDTLTNKTDLRGRSNKFMWVLEIT